MSDLSPTAGPARPSPPYFDLLTALRGLAVLAVVLFHLCISFRTNVERPHTSFGWLLPVFNTGWFGVDVFFLISGYGLTAKLTGGRIHSGARGALSFAQNRAWRIFPVYWLCCVAVVALAYASSHFNHLDWRLEFPGDLRGVLASVLLIEPFTGTPPLLPIITWTLNCELGFYAIVMLGILVRPRVSDTVLVWTAVALAFAGMSGRMPVLGWLFAFWPQFACGLLVFAAVGQRFRGRAGAFRAAIGTLAIIGVAAWLDNQARLAATAGLGLLLIAVWPADELLCRQSPVRWLQWCGQISYPLFLLHVPVGSRVVNLCRRLVPANSVLFGLVIAGALLVSMGAALVVHHWFELPTQTLARRRPALPI